MVEFRTASKGRKEYSKVIMPEEKDKIVHELLNKEGNVFYFEYKNVPDLNISMVQFEKVMIELEDMGMLKIEGYKNGGKIYLNSKLDTFYRYGGFKMQDQMLSNDLERLKLELESLKKTVEPPVSEKVKTITEIAASITSALAFAFGGVQP